MLFNGILAGLAIVIFWVGALTFWVFRIYSHYNRLTSKTKKAELSAILDKLLEGGQKTGEDIKKVREAFLDFERRSLGHIQKVGVVRFNPFPETGGNQSFALSLLDGADSGVVILSLHGREGTRIYLKQVKHGRSGTQLSKEEEQAIGEAKGR